MQAAVIRRHGGPEVVGVEDVPAPTAGPGEVVIEVKAAALNHLDLWVAKGGRAELPMPHILGSDAAGVIVEVGRGAHGLVVGQPVMVNCGLSCGHCEFCLRGEQSQCADFGIVGLNRPGTFAQRLAVPAANVAGKPEHLDWAEAAALSLAHLTAWRMVFNRGQLRPGETVLIHGIGGGVALAALQWAKFIQSQAIVTSSSPEKLGRAKLLGADAGINYRQTPDVAAEVRKLTAQRGVDLVIDTVGAATLQASLHAARRGGRIVTCGVTTGPQAAADLRAIYWNQLSLLGSTLGSHEDYRRMVRAVSDGKLEPVLDCTMPLAQARAALERMAAGEQFGKIVLRLDEKAD
jgi:NADPH:quinone reductase-like Zn-dependent oxidoreductase